MKAAGFHGRGRNDAFSRMTDEQRLAAFTNILTWAGHVVFLGGAGVSTESGIPDFRSKDGLYHKTEKRFARYRPEWVQIHESKWREGA